MLAQQKPNHFEEIIIKLFKRTTSVCIMILGRRETGKTDLSLLIMQIIAKFDIMANFSTNIKIYESPFHVEHITNLEDLEFWCKNTHGKKLFILDEAGKSLRRRTPMSGLNIQLLDNLQILRKYKLSIIMIAPHQKYVDSATLGSDVLDAMIIKPNYRNPKIALYVDIMEDNEIRLIDLPPTQLKFDTWDVAPFKKNAPSVKPKFKERDLDILWDWSHGKTCKEIGVHQQELSRISRKFLKEVLERTSHKSQPIAIEDTTTLANVTETQN